MISETSLDKPSNTVHCNGDNINGKEDQYAPGDELVKMLGTTPNRWYYPQDIANDLQDVDLPKEVKEEIFATAWEYSRCVVPQYTNWRRYVAFMRIIIIGTIAEFRGSLVDVCAGDSILGYSLDGVLSALFEGTLGQEAMAREYKTFLLITAEKASNKRNSEMFRRYVNSLSTSPRQWFRLRDTDALCRFTIASALACNDLDHIWFSDQQFEVLAEIGDMCYDAISFYKHRSEGETNSTFAYMPAELRNQAYHQCRELLWALDVAWAKQSELTVVVNFVRYFGGPIHMMMRRYRFVEEDLTIGTPETQEVIDLNRKNFKLWNRVDVDTKEAVDGERYREIVSSQQNLMFEGLPHILERDGDGSCDDCRYRSSYGADVKHMFGGVQLCESCRDEWRDWFWTLPMRAAKIFPSLGAILDNERERIHTPRAVIGRADTSEPLTNGY